MFIWKETLLCVIGAYFQIRMCRTSLWALREEGEKGGKACYGFTNVFKIVWPSEKIACLCITRWSHIYIFSLFSSLYCSVFTGCRWELPPPPPKCEISSHNRDNESLIPAVQFFFPLREITLFTKDKKVVEVFLETSHWKSAFNLKHSYLLEENSKECFQPSGWKNQRVLLLSLWIKIAYLKSIVLFEVFIDSPSPGRLCRICRRLEYDTIY